MIRRKERGSEAAPTASETAGPETASAAESAPPVDTESAEAANLLTELERARAREDDLVRALAELTNVNRRRRQEMETSLLYAQESLIRDLLPVLDDIDRALEASKDRANDPVRAGVLLIRERLWRTLEKEGLESISPKGERFDPELHDAVAHRPSEEPSDTVLEVTLPGYRLKGRVLRHAQVVVAGPRGEGAGA